MLYILDEEQDQDIIADLNRTKEQNIMVEREFMVNHLRMWSTQFDIREKELFIPDGCEKNGFPEGNYNIGELLHFLADMLEE